MIYINIENTLIFTVDFKSVKNEFDLVYRIRKSFSSFTHVSEEEYLRRVKKNDYIYGPGWDALIDDLFEISYTREFQEFSKSGKKLENVIIYLENYSDVVNNLGKVNSNHLSDILLCLTDKKGREMDFDYWVKIKS